MATLLLKLLLPGLVTLIVTILNLYRSAKAKGVAIDGVVADVLKKATDELKTAAEATIAAESDHLNKLDDSAFDPDFKREGP